MHWRYLPSATSHYIRCRKIDQHFGSCKPDQIDFGPPQKLSRSRFRDTEPAWIASKGNQYKGIAKRTRNCLEILQVIAKHREEPPNYSIRTKGVHCETSRKDETLILFTDYELRQKMVSWIAQGASGCIAKSSRSISGYSEALRDRPRSIAKRHFGTIAGSRKRLPTQSVRKASGVSGHFGLIRKQPETARNLTGKNFLQAEMNELFPLLGRNDFRDDCGRCFTPFPTLHLLRVLCKNDDRLILENLSRSSIILMFSQCAYQK